MVKLSIDDIKKTIEDCKSMGFDLRMADIFYTFALQGFNDKNLVYAMLFGKGKTGDLVVEAYDSSKKIKFLKKYMKTNFFDKNSGKTANAKKQYDDISFEENKAYMLKLKKDTEEAMSKGDIEKKDGLKILTDLSVKLNDKFAVSEKQDEQRIIVYKKYNDTCVCGREIYRPTRDDIIEDLKEEYDLVPKKKDNGDE